jgi:hypothetical protein
LRSKTDIEEGGSLHVLETILSQNIIPNPVKNIFSPFNHCCGTSWPSHEQLHKRNGEKSFKIGEMKYVVVYY